MVKLDFQEFILYNLLPLFVLTITKEIKKTTAFAVVLIRLNVLLKRYFIHFFSALEVHCFLASFVSNINEVNLLGKSAQKDGILYS